MFSYSPEAPEEREQEEQKRDEDAEPAVAAEQCRAVLQAGRELSPPRGPRHKRGVRKTKRRDPLLGRSSGNARQDGKQWLGVREEVRRSNLNCVDGGETQPHRGPKGSRNIIEHGLSKHLLVEYIQVLLTNTKFKIEAQTKSNWAHLLRGLRVGQLLERFRRPYRQYSLVWQSLLYFFEWTKHTTGGKVTKLKTENWPCYLKSKR